MGVSIKFTFYGACALQFPSNYVLIDAEEMEYLDGGYKITKKECSDICAAICLTPTYTAIAMVGVILPQKAVKAVSLTGGFVGWAAGTLLSTAIGVVGSQLLTMARGLIAGALVENGVDFSFAVNCGKNQFGLS